MTTTKWQALAVYGLMAIASAVFNSTIVVTIIEWIFIGLLAVHLLEFVMVYKVLKASPGPMAGHFLHTLVFGFVHWLPLKKIQA
jgi:predicted acyltransferase